MEDLRGYSKEYFQLVKAVPNLVGNVFAQVTPELEQNCRASDIMKHNLEEEKQHVAPWVSFAESIGVARNDLYEYECSRKTQDAVYSMNELTRESFAAGVSALYAYEKQLPDISTKKIEGLVNFYGVKNEEALNYFRIHKTVDIEHAELWHSLIEQLPGSLHETILSATSKSLMYQNMILDGVCDTYLAGRDQMAN